VTLRGSRSLHHNARWYVVAYDIPVTPPAARRRFYRKIRKYIQDNHQADAVFLAQSTIATKSRELARFVLDLVESFGDDSAKACMFKGSLEAVIGDAVR